MAIIRNVVMRGASKRLGGVVFYTRSGETVARELAPSVSNPRTDVQMQQRVKLANVVGAYKANKAWMAGAFEDKAEKESDYNAFVRFNLSNSRVALTKSQASSGSSIVAPYKVSSGSLGSIDCTGQTTGVRSNIYTGNLVITPTTTIKNLSDAILANNNGIEKGMQLSLIVNIQRSDANQFRPYIVVRAYEIIIDDTNTDLLSDYFPYGILSTLDLEGKPLFFNAESIGSGAATFMLSKTVSGRLYVSSQTLCQFGDQSLYTIYTSDTAIAAAVQSYGENADRFLDSNKAEINNPVIFDNYIQVLMYRDVAYPVDSVVPTNFNSQYLFSFFIAKAVPANAVLTMVLDGEDIEIDSVHATWNETRTRVDVVMPGGHDVSVETNATFVIEYDNVVMEFDFTGNPTE